MGWYSDFMADWLHTAIEQDSFYEAKTAIALGANVNKLDEYGSPPLWNSILHKRDEIIVLLLKNKADPNQHYKDLFHKNTTHSITQGSIHGEDKSLIQLLVLHGGITQSLIYSDRHLYLKEVVVQAEKYYQMLKQLQMQLAQDSAYPWIYRELAHFWQELSRQESNTTFRAYYIEKSQTALRHAEELVRQAKKKEAKSSFHHFALEEKRPLLETTAINKAEQTPTNFSLHLKRE